MRLSSRFAWLAVVGVGFLLAPVVTQAQAPPTVAAGSSIGKDVTVTITDRSRRQGALLSLSATEVVLRGRGGDVTLPLTDVRVIQRDTHAIRNGVIVGLAASIGVMVAVCSIESGCTAPEVAKDAPWLAGIGVAAGAGIGALLRPSAASRTIYPLPAKATVAVAPTVGGRTIGVAGTITW